MKKNEKPVRKIHSNNGAFIQGNVNTGGGDIVGRDQTKTVVEGDIRGGTLITGSHNIVKSESDAVSMTDFTKLVSEIHALITEAKLEEDTRSAVENDVQVVEAQITKPNPKAALVLPRLKAIAETLGTAVVTGEAIQKLIPMLQQAIHWAQQLFK